MLNEFLTNLSQWNTQLDTWIVVTAALSAMACALPGNFLLLRRQSMMGDALSHTALLGIVCAFLFAYWMVARGWISPEAETGWQFALMFAGAIAVGILSALLTEGIHQLGHVEESASLGVVFTTLFALGLLLIRVAADSVHIDPACVFYGRIEMVSLDTFGTSGIPHAAVSNAIALVVNAFLIVLLFKELRISTFDPQLSTAVGISARVMNYALMGATAATVVAAFESVGSILVIAMLIVPPATARVLTDRLWVMILLSLLFAAISAVLGHVIAITVPRMIFSRLGFDAVQDASTSGMIAVVAGLMFLMAILVSPRHGLIGRAISRIRLTIRIVSEDLLGLLYRLEEAHMEEQTKQAPQLVAQAIGFAPVLSRLALWNLRWRGRVDADQAGYHLTQSGREIARRLVRSHRLWESYLKRHFSLPEDHLHQAAERVEHYLGPEQREELARELDQPAHDPHGKEIPGEPNGASEK